jgi:hypothetical protein
MQRIYRLTSMLAFIRHKVLINSGVGEAVYGGFGVVRDSTKTTRVGGRSFVSTVCWLM